MKTRLRLWARHVALFAAGAAGILGRTVPGVLGPLGIYYGLWLVYPPVAYIAAGALLMYLDWRTK